MAHFAIIKLSYIMEDKFWSTVIAMYLYIRSKMAIIISDEHDLGSGIVLHYRSLQNINFKPKSVAQSNSQSLN